MISPCPFSKGYKIPTQQAWFLLKGFSFYRLILSCLLLALYFSQIGNLLIKPAYTQLYMYTSFSYFIVTLIGWVFIIRRKPNYAYQAQILVFSDIFLITIIMHSCGGESLLLRKLILGIQAQVRSKSLTGLIKICDALIRPASTYKNPRGVFI